LASPKKPCQDPFNASRPDTEYRIHDDLSDAGALHDDIRSKPDNSHLFERGKRRGRSPFLLAEIKTRKGDW